jgi:nucleotidyltransferase substrate binding protein (TIGR01987 family)
MGKDVRWKQRFQNFEKALAFLQSGVEKPELSRIEEAGVIQAYEFTFELGWKTLKDFLEENLIIAPFPREAIKEAFRSGLIQDGDAWMDMLEKRNLMSHSYDEKQATLALRLIRDRYFPILRALKDQLKTK